MFGHTETKPPTIDDVIHWYACAGNNAETAMAVEEWLMSFRPASHKDPNKITVYQELLCLSKAISQIQPKRKDGQKNLTFLDVIFGHWNVMQWILGRYYNDLPDPSCVNPPEWYMELCNIANKPAEPPSKQRLCSDVVAKMLEMLKP